MICCCLSFLCVPAHSPPSSSHFASPLHPRSLPPSHPTHHPHSALSKTSYLYQEEYAAFASFTLAVTGELERRALLAQAAQMEKDLKAAANKKGGARKPAPKPAAAAAAGQS